MIHVILTAVLFGISFMLLALKVQMSQASGFLMLDHLMPIRYWASGFMGVALLSISSWLTRLWWFKQGCLLLLGNCHAIIGWEFYQAPRRTPGDLLYWGMAALAFCCLFIDAFRFRLTVVSVQRGAR